MDIKTKIFGKIVPRMNPNDYIRKYWKVFALIYILNIIDAFITLHALKTTDVHEANQIMAFMLSYTPLFIVFKMFLLFIAFIFVYWMSSVPRIHKASLIYLILFFLIIDINNIMLTMGFRLVQIGNMTIF